MMGIHHMNATSSFVFGSTHNHIYVHELVSESKGPVETVINGKTLTYSTSPALGEKIGSLHLEYGFEWSHTFPCAMDSLHAFALVAADDVTHVEWWQDKQSLLPGKRREFACRLRSLITCSQPCTSNNTRRNKEYCDVPLYIIVVPVNCISFRPLLIPDRVFIHNMLC